MDSQNLPKPKKLEKKSGLEQSLSTINQLRLTYENIIEDLESQNRALSLDCSQLLNSTDPASLEKTEARIAVMKINNKNKLTFEGNLKS
jgi:hypothetical protein